LWKPHLWKFPQSWILTLHLRSTEAPLTAVTVSVGAALPPRLRASDTAAEAVSAHSTSATRIGIPRTDIGRTARGNDTDRIFERASDYQRLRPDSQPAKKRAEVSLIVTIYNEAGLEIAEQLFIMMAYCGGKQVSGEESHASIALGR
jgi:hypothetical protein